MPGMAFIVLISINESSLTSYCLTYGDEQGHKMNHLKAEEIVEQQHRVLVRSKLDGWFFNLKVFLINVKKCH